MYIYVIKLECVTEEQEEFWAEFTVQAEDESKAINNARIKARKDGYRLRWQYDAKEPIVRKL